MKTKVDKKGKKRSLSETSVSVQLNKKQENVNELKKNPKKTKLAGIKQNGSPILGEKVPTSKVVDAWKKEQNKTIKQQSNIVERSETKRDTKEKESIVKPKKEIGSRSNRSRRRRPYHNLNLTAEQITKKIAEIKSREVLSKRAKKILGVLNRKLREYGNKSDKLDTVGKKSNKKTEHSAVITSIKKAEPRENTLMNKQKANDEDEVKEKKYFQSKGKPQEEDDDDSDVEEDDDDSDVEEDDDDSDVEEEIEDETNESKAENDLIKSLLKKRKEIDDESDEEEEEDEEDEDEEDEQDEEMESEEDIEDEEEVESEEDEEEIDSEEDEEDEEDEEVEEAEEDEENEKDIIKKAMLSEIRKKEVQNKNKQGQNKNQQEQNNKQNKNKQEQIKNKQEQNKNKQVSQALDNQEKGEIKKKRYVLFVGNLPLNVTEEEIKQHFLPKVNTITSIRIPTKPDKTQRGFAYVEVTNNIDFEKGLSLHHTFLNKRRINVQYSIPTGGNKTDAKKIVAKNMKLQALQKAGKLGDGNQKKPFQKKNK